MKFHTQTLFGGIDAPPHERGNCYQACVASLLDLDLDEVPHFLMHDDWAPRAQAWYAERGLAFLSYEGNPFANHPLYERFVYFAIGPSVRGHMHCVLYRGAQLLHDPHPSRSGLTQVTHVETLAIVDVDRFRDAFTL